MKRRRSLFVHLNQLRVLAKKFALVILFVAAIMLMLFNKNGTIGFDTVSGVGTGAAAKVVEILVVPAKLLSRGYDYFSELNQIKNSNRLLKAENKELMLLKDKYQALEIENKLLSGLLNYVPLLDVGFVSARVVAEESDTFAHSMVAYVGDKNVAKGDVVLSDRGVVGRIDKVNGGYAKIIMITDINSKIPVIIEQSRVRAILSGDNTTVPKLIFVPLDTEINIGDRIVTSGVSGVFPAGLPIGQVVAVSKSEIRVKPLAALEKLEYVKIVKYGKGGLLDGEDGVAE
jgi:rod shape-determining protein MreC